MKQLYLLINSLPLVLQDLINEFNIEHRPKMKYVLNELLENEPYTLICKGCNIYKIGITLYSVIPNNFVCSKKCLKIFINMIPDGCPDKHCFDEMF
jgi:hypothetical protein